MRVPSFSAIERAVAILLGDGDDGASTPTFTGSEIPLDAQVAALELAIKGLQKRRNVRLPIHQLPVELFSAILLYSLPQERVVMRVLELERVSIHWWNQIRGSPQLWAFAEPGRNLALALERSGNTALQVLHPSQWRSAREAEDFAFRVGEHAHRWRVLQYTGPHISFLAPYLEDVLPVVETIDLQSSEQRDDLPSLDIVGGPRLRHLKVHNVNLDLTTIQPSLSNLQTLRIRSPPEPDISWDALHDVLVLCPRLEELCLARLGINNEDDIGFAADSLILPSMRTIDLFHVGSAVLSPFLQDARAPLLKKLFIIANENDDPVVPKLQASNSILGSVIQNNISKNVVLRVTALNPVFDFELGTNSETRVGILRITSRGGRWRDVVGEGAEFHSTVAEHKIPMELKLGADLVHDYTFLAALSTLASLVINEPVGLHLMESLFHFLGRGQKEASQLPCPNLTKLDVEGNHSLYKAAKRLLEIRQTLAKVKGTPVQRLRLRLSGTEVFV
ncbi:hypothetical protein M407DRAFT_26715 [Tulasnella calospora MUT 4182]|uniref:F-box domain-containing protein n=1 Tax=Tulasnella calospora MUT 4182 TaxID=1051891 RepID=A0A0C3KR49_9AGAM|nr:hypothetical protein M407DRAFT_26715 [Tulasnella calospora MUT 4182]